MNTKTKVNLVLGSIVVCCMLIVVSVAIPALNELLGTTENTGEKYVSSYTYCGAWAGAGGQNHCTMWLTGHETRVKTLVHGYWWETTSSELAK
jgi:hypothetical protein